PHPLVIAGGRRSGKARHVCAADCRWRYQCVGGVASESTRYGSRCGGGDSGVIAQTVRQTNFTAELERVFPSRPTQPLRERPEVRYIVIVVCGPIEHLVRLKVDAACP